MDQLQSVRLFATFKSNPVARGYTPRNRFTMSVNLASPCAEACELNNPMSDAIAFKSASGMFCLPFRAVRRTD